MLAFYEIDCYIKRQHSTAASVRDADSQLTLVYPAFEPITFPSARAHAVLALERFRCAKTNAATGALDSRKHLRISIIDNEDNQSISSTR